MEFSEIMRRIPDMSRLPDGSAAGDLSRLKIAGITADSRQVKPGYLFAALPGVKIDGRAFIGDAVARGAAIILAPENTQWPPGVPPRPMITDPEPRRRLAQVAAAFYGAQPATMVAVTGTNGKTSTVEFLRQIWMLAGLPAASLGTLGMVAPGHVPGAGLTTPDPVSLHATLAQLTREGVAHAAMEASSHGLDQFRLDGVRLNAAGFSNLTRDHLDYHGSLDAYRAAKLRLFTTLLPQGAPAVANTEMDPETLLTLQEIAERRKLMLLTVGEEGAAVKLLSAIPRPDGQDLSIDVFGERRLLSLKLPGRFQADNALLAATLAYATGTDEAFGFLPQLNGVRGRLELAATLPNDVAVYVDFAHTPDALERLLIALRPHARGRLHIVLGAGGDRDRGKRPLMGAVATRYADRVIVTDDNPRTEDPASIRAGIMAACPGATEIGDRRTAISSAMNDLAPGDVLVVAGKGHEQGQTVGKETLPFDDASVVRRFAGMTE